MEDATSEANNTWRVSVGGAEHDIGLDHSTMTGKVVVRLDGREVEQRRMLFRSQEAELDVAGARAVVKVDFAYAGFAAKSELHLDGRYVEPLRR